MNNPEITLYGFGYVGQAVHKFLEHHYGIQVFDPFVERSFVVKEWDDIRATPYAVICVPTPARNDGSCDIDAVEDIVRRTPHEYYLIKSTVPPGTTAQLAKTFGKHIAFSPEYLGEAGYPLPFWKDVPHPTDMRLHGFYIFGGAKAVTSKWLEIWQRVAGWAPVYSETDSTTAELVKYMENAFLATKKIFCDEFYDLAQLLSVDYNELKNLWLLDGRIGRAMTVVHADNRGFGGKCLSKDVLAMTRCAMNHGYDTRLLRAVISINDDLRSARKPLTEDRKAPSISS